MSLIDRIHALIHERQPEPIVVCPELSPKVTLPSTRRFQWYPGSYGSSSPAGTEILIVPPVDRLWKILVLHWRVATAADVGNRLPIFSLFYRGSAELLDMRLPQVPASTIVDVYLYKGIAYSTWTGGTVTNYFLPLPAEGLLTEDAAIRLYVNAPLGTDFQWATIYYEESELPK